MVKMDPSMNQQDPNHYPPYHPPPPPPPSGYGRKRGGGSGASDDAYYQHPRRSPKFSEYDHGQQGHGHSSGGPPLPPLHYQAPYVAQESRYPPSSAARRHENYTRHPPPLHHHGQEYLPHHQPLHPPPALPHPADKFGKTITVSNRLTIRDNNDGRSEDYDTDPEDKGDEEDKVVRCPSLLLPSKRSSAFLPYRPSAVIRPVVTVQLAPPATTTTSNSGKARSSSVIDSDGASDDEIMAANSQIDDETDDLGKVDDEGGLKESRDDNNVKANESKKTTSSEEERVSSGEEGRDRPIILGPSSSFPPEVACRGGWNGEGRVCKPNPISTFVAPGDILKRIKRTRSEASEKDGANAEDDTPKHININRKASFSHQRQVGDVHRYSDSSGDPNKRLRPSNFGFDLSKGSGEGYDGYDYKPPCDENRSLSSLENETYDRHDQPAATGGSHEITGYSQQGRNQPYEQYHQELQRGNGREGGTARGIQSSWMTPNTITAPPLDYANSHDYAGTGSLLNYSRSLSWEVPAGTLSGIGNSLTFGRSLSAEEHAKEETAMGKGIPSLKSTDSTLNLPQRKRPVLLAPRPLPTTDETRDNSCDKGKQKYETFEPRDVPPVEPLRLEEEGQLQHQQSSSYAPTMVHFPAVRQHPMHHHHQPEHYHQPYPQQNHHPSQVRTYDQQYYNTQHPPPLHSPSQHHYKNDRGGYDYDPHYERPRGDYRGPSGGYPQGGDGERRYDHSNAYESSGRYNPHSTPHVYSSGRDGAPWGPPPHSSNNPRQQQQPRHFDNNYPPQQYPRQHHLNDADPSHYTGTPGGHGAGLDRGNGIYTSDSRSFDSTLSKKSLRSLDDLEDPGQSLLYRPSFSWERGLDVPVVPGGTPPRSSAVALPLPPLPSSSTNSSLSQLSQQQKIMRTLTMRNEVRTIGDPNAHIPLILLLAMPQDRHCLSETLCIVRNNVEVFTATECDINAPAPGRKRPIQVGQVGLRCVYCRMCHQRDRVKRATCFPSSMKRIYRAVIDMKLDHFKNCPYVPTGLKARLDQLQAGSTRSTGMTVQYFIKSAKELGMTDNVEDGVFIDLYRVGNSRIAEQDYNVTSPPLPVAAGGVNNAMVPYDSHLHTGQDYHQTKQPKQRKTNPHPRMVPHVATSHDVGNDSKIPEKRFAGKVLLSLPEDENSLSPLRCFLREHVCAFTASQQDIAVRTPTTFSVRVGQVGVGCVHCLAVPPKSRSNRAVCFPFAMARIYQSVADIQRFHLGECRMMPPNVRAEFLRLQSESAKGSRGLATRMYWIDSAKKIGLTDGASGMYFRRDPSLPPSEVDSDTSVKSLDILDQAVSNYDSRSICHSLVVPEDKPTIAKFLYLVMEQLRPCRFTDADRNKRRSKNVGCIGVECKHCAGKIDGRKFFWSSVSAAESNFVSVHSHMLTCKYISEPLKAEVMMLKSLRREQTSRLKTGSQKAFFIRVWSRLHGEPILVPPPSIEDARKLSSAGKGKPSQQRFFAPEDSAGHPFMSSADAEYDDNTGDYEVSPILCSNSSYEINALFETKSTLSSMPSVDDLIVKNDEQDAEASKVDLIAKSSSNESAFNIETAASKGSLKIDIERLRVG